MVVIQIILNELVKSSCDPNNTLFSYNGYISNNTQSF